MKQIAAFALSVVLVATFAGSARAGTWHKTSSGCSGESYIISGIWAYGLTQGSAYVIGCSAGQLYDTTNSGANWSEIWAGPPSGDPGYGAGTTGIAFTELHGTAALDSYGYPWINLPGGPTYDTSLPDIGGVTGYAAPRREAIAGAYGSYAVLWDSWDNGYPILYRHASDTDGCTNAWTQLSGGLAADLGGQDASNNFWILDYQLHPWKAGIIYECAVTWTEVDSTNSFDGISANYNGVFVIASDSKTIKKWAGGTTWTSYGIPGYTGSTYTTEIASGFDGGYEVWATDSTGGIWYYN